MKKYIRRFECTFPDCIKIIEIKSDLPFGIGEAKAEIKKNHPTVREIKYLKSA